MQLESPNIPSLLALTLIVLGACASHPSAVGPGDPAARTASAAVARFHAGLAHGQYVEMCRTIEPHALAAGTALPCRDYLAYVHDRLGNVVEAQRAQLPVVQAGPGDTARVALDYAARFDRGDAREHFEWRVTGTETLLTSYRIDTRALSH